MHPNQEFFLWLYFSQFLHLPSSTLATQIHLCWLYKPCAKILLGVTTTVMGNAGAGTLEQFWPERTTANPIIPTQDGARKVTRAGGTGRVFADSLSGLLVQIDHRLPSHPKHILRGAAASGSSQLALQVVVSRRSEGPRTGSPCAGTGEPESTRTHVEKMCLQLWLRQI